MKRNEKKERRGWGSALKCGRSYIRLISHPFSSNLLIKQVLQEVKRCVSKPHEDRWHPSASFERDKREPEWGIKQNKEKPTWVGEWDCDNRWPFKCAKNTTARERSASSRRNNRRTYLAFCGMLSRVCLCTQRWGKQQSDRWYQL